MRAVLLGFALLSLPCLAHAQDDGGPAVADTSLDEEARALFAAGRTAFEAGRFADALGYFERSHELSGRPLLLFNIGSAHDRLRHDEEALAAFEAYLREVPDAPNAQEVAGRVEVLRAAIASRTHAAEPEPVALVDEAATPPPPPREFAPIGSSILAGLALVTGGVAVWSWVDANARYQGLESGCFAARGVCTDEEIAASGTDTQVTVTNVLLVSSLALAAAAIVVLVLEIPMGGGESAPTASLRIGPGSLAVGGTF